MKNSQQAKKAAGMENKELPNHAAETKNFEHIREGHGGFGGVAPEPSKAESKDASE